MRVWNTTQKTYRGETIEVIARGEQIQTDEAREKFDLGDCCYICGRKIGKSPWHVQMSVAGDLLPFDFDAGSDSQGCFPIGSECRKDLPKSFTGKF